MSKNIFSSVHNCTLYTKSMRRRIANFEYFWKGIVSVSYVSRNATEIAKKKYTIPTEIRRVAYYLNEKSFQYGGIAGTVQV